MDLLGSALVVLAGVSLGLGVFTSGSRRRRPLIQQLIARSRRDLAGARISADPRYYLLLRLGAPLLLFAIGWLQSPVLAVGAGSAGLLVPRGYLSWLVHVRARHSEAEAGRLVQSLIAGLTGGGTYLDALREARARCGDAWLSQDLDLVIQRFLLDAPLHASLKEVRARTTSRNLGLIWETLSVCTENHLPTQKARGLLLELSGTVQFNVQMANEVRARSAGQRAQIWLLAVIVPGMFLYLHWMSPDLLSVLDSTVFGRLILFPLAVSLEIAGILLSFRIARLPA
jgi:Flp pilus assembly protein TadB